MLSLDYYWQKIQERISKIRYPYNRVIQLIIVILILLSAINIDYIKKYIGIYHDDLNFLMIISLFAIIIAAVVYTLKKFYSTTSKRLNFLMIIALFTIVFAASLYTYDYFHLPKPPEDKLVVAISPFYYIDESGKSGSDINTANDFKEKLEADKALKIKIIMLNDPIHDAEDAKFQGEKKGAHIIVYGETKSKIGNIGEIKYFILPLPSLDTIPSKAPSQYA